MADTIHALVCFGGTGRTFTMTIASPCVVTLTRHGLRDGSGVYFTTTGALPTGIVAGVKYYAKETAANTFNIYTDAACTNIVNTSGTQSGVHTIYGAYYYELTTEQKARYIYSGNTFIYYSLSAMNSGLSSWLTSNPDTTIDIIAEFSDSFIDKDATVGTTLGLVCGSLSLTSMIDGARTDAFHNGIPGTGYLMQLNGNSQITLILNMYNIEVDGLSFQNTTANGGTISSGPLAAYIRVCNNILYGDRNVTGQTVCSVSAVGSVSNNLILNAGGAGVKILQYSGLGCKYFNNIVAKCTGYGITTGGSNQGLFTNNISVGNGTNWGPPPSYGSYRGSYNYGEVSDYKEASVDIAVSTANMTITAHGKVAGAMITFKTTGTLPAITATGAPLVPGKTYYVRTVVNVNTITLATSSSGATFVFTSNGTGIHKTPTIWSTDGTEIGIDMTTPADVFVGWDATPINLKPANASAPQVDTALTVDGEVAVDMLNAVRPNYSAGAATDAWDGGCFEYDSGNGIAPIQVPITITNLVADSSIIIETLAGTVILSPLIVTGTSHSFSYTYTGDVTIVLKVRNRRNGNWQPYEQTGVITSSGCNFYVSQVAAVV